jgi:ribosomal protein S18 acetylase RimI-like enzyme
MVAPSHFRRGIASRLLEHALAMAGPDATFHVSTGRANAPAIMLYKKYGFLEGGLREVEPGIEMLKLTRPAPYGALVMPRRRKFPCRLAIITLGPARSPDA